MLTSNIAKANRIFRGVVKYNEELAKHTTIKTGGKTPLWFIPKDVEDLSKFLIFAKDAGLDIVVLGNGSNVIIKDGKLNFIFINLSSSYFQTIHSKNNIVKVRAGVNLKNLIGYCTERNLSGIEYFTMIPATVGGAVVNNIGVKFNNKLYEFSNIVHKIKLLDNETAELEEYSSNEFYPVRSNSSVEEENFLFKGVKFGYHSSNLKNKTIIEVSLNLEYGDYNKILSTLKALTEYRKNFQHYNLPSCGCIFKNPRNYKAGKLIQDSGLKGKRIGDAMVSTKHANFIINCGDACSRDVLELIRLVQEKVFENSNIWLEPEVEIIG